MFDHEGNAFLSHGKFVTRLKPDGTSQIWAEMGAPDGHKVMGDDSHLICDDHAVILHLNKDGKLIGKITEADGKPLRAPRAAASRPAPSDALRKMSEKSSSSIAGLFARKGLGSVLSTARRP